MKLIPLPPSHGYGFSVFGEPLDDVDAKPYRLDKVGPYYNYHFSAESCCWPQRHRPLPLEAVIDGFSPNLNKQLHIGHLRNLAVGSSLVKLTGTARKPVALLGKAVGTMHLALDNLAEWYKIAGYDPVLYSDTEMVNVFELHPNMIQTRDGEGEKLGCKVWDGPKGDVIVRKSDGTSTYALHDLVFAKRVGPTHYVTAAEQSQHFESLGLKDKHLPMGLVLGEDGKKMSSRDGNGMSAVDAMALIRNSLDDSTIPLAWNVLAWNFLSVNRTQNVKFIPKLWSNPDSGGLYISYTYARLNSALKNAGMPDVDGYTFVAKLDDEDLPLMAATEYFYHSLSIARDNMDPCPIATYALMLAKAVGSAMQKHRVIGGRASFQSVAFAARRRLRECMELLTMYPLESV